MYGNQIFKNSQGNTEERTSLIDYQKWRIIIKEPKLRQCGLGINLDK